MGKELYFDATKVDADAATCNACPVKAACTDTERGRTIQRSFHTAYLEKVRGYHATEAYKKAMRKRKVWVEPLVAEAKMWHGLRPPRHGRFSIANNVPTPSASAA